MLFSFVENIALKYNGIVDNSKVKAFFNVETNTFFFSLKILTMFSSES